MGACATPTPTPITQEGSASTKLEEVSEPPIDPKTEANYQEQLRALIAEVSKSHSIPLESLELGFRDSKNLSHIKKLVAPPPVTFQKNWRVYRSRFVEPICDV